MKRRGRFFFMLGAMMGWDKDGVPTDAALLDLGLDWATARPGRAAEGTPGATV